MSDIADIMHAIAARDEYVDLKIAAAIRDARNAALEEAAKVAENSPHWTDNGPPLGRMPTSRDDIAAAIRAMIPQEDK